MDIFNSCPRLMKLPLLKSYEKQGWQAATLPIVNELVNDPLYIPTRKIWSQIKKPIYFTYKPRGAAGKTHWGFQLNVYSNSDKFKDKYASCLESIINKYLGELNRNYKYCAHNRYCYVWDVSDFEVAKVLEDMMKEIEQELTKQIGAFPKN